MIESDESISRMVVLSGRKKKDSKKQLSQSRINKGLQRSVNNLRYLSIIISWFLEKHPFLWIYHLLVLYRNMKKYHMRNSTKNLDKLNNRSTRGSLFNSLKEANLKSMMRQSTEKPSFSSTLKATLKKKETGFGWIRYHSSASTPQKAKSSAFKIMPMLPNVISLLNPSLDQKSRKER